MNCFYCRNDAGKVGTDLAAVLCGDCVQRLTGAPVLAPVMPKLSADEKAERKAARVARKTEKLDKLKTAKRGRGRGWHLKKLFEFEGQYFTMGAEITAAEAAKIRKLLAKAPQPDPFKLPVRRGRKPKVTKR